jgi:hypothetical protein
VCQQRYAYVCVVACRTEEVLSDAPHHSHWKEWHPNNHGKKTRESNDQDYGWRQQTSKNYNCVSRWKYYPDQSPTLVVKWKAKMKDTIISIIIFVFLGLAAVKWIASMFRGLANDIRHPFGGTSSSSWTPPVNQTNQFTANIRLDAGYMQKVTIEADNFFNAKALLESQYGKGNALNILRVMKR